MTQIIQGKESKQQNSFIEFIKRECVLVIAIILAIASSLIAKPKVSYIDFKVLILLFNLMIVVSAFKNLNVLDSIAISLLKRCNTYTSVSFALVFITFVSAMVVTNDVALITFVPLSIVIAKKANISVLKIVVFQTLAANLGSSFTPMGNPQNLFIYSFYNLSPIDFLKITLPIAILAIIFLIMLIIKDKKMNLTVDLESIKIDNKRDVTLFSILFIIILLSVFHLVDYKLTFIITIVMVLLLNRSLFKDVDYSLLITFIGFFIFVGNISTLDVVRNFMENILNSKESTYFSSILASQVISNVPATMLLSGFTSNFRELLLGVNIGGMGTLIASLASVISYKIYMAEFKEEGNSYFKSFTVYNLIGLILFILIIFFII